MTARIPGPLSRLGLSVALAAFLVDQAAKLIASRALDYGVPSDLVPGLLSLLLIHNTGIAFSIGHGLDSLALIVLTAVITVAVLWIWRGASEGGRLATVGFALILGGAVGNLVDRVLYGHVVDFLYLHLGERSLFVFNLADVALTFGPILLAGVHLLGWGGGRRTG